jgi:hypothetical protein
MKENPICEICTGWYGSITINGVEWQKCMSCGNMKKSPKVIITPLPKQGRPVEKN